MKLAAPTVTCVADCPTCGTAVPVIVHAFEAGRIRQFCDACSAVLCVGCEGGRVTGIVDLDLDPQDCPETTADSDVNQFDSSRHIPSSADNELGD